MYKYLYLRQSKKYDSRKLIDDIDNHGNRGSKRLWVFYILVVPILSTYNRLLYYYYRQYINLRKKISIVVVYVDVYTVQGRQRKKLYYTILTRYKPILCNVIRIYHGLVHGFCLFKYMFSNEYLQQVSLFFLVPV